MKLGGAPPLFLETGIETGTVESICLASLAEVGKARLQAKLPHFGKTLGKTGSDEEKEASAHRIHDLKLGFVDFNAQPCSRLLSLTDPTLLQRSGICGRSCVVTAKLWLLVNYWPVF